VKAESIMKKLITSAILTAILLSAAAQAGQQVQLANINTNNCQGVRGEIQLLSTPEVVVNAVCSEYIPQGYRSTDGKFYDYRVYTTVEIPGYLSPGQTFQLGNINTNNCERAQRLISMLSTRSVMVNPSCSEYIHQGYPSGNGRSYDYRLYTHVTVY